MKGATQKKKDLGGDSPLALAARLGVEVCATLTDEARSKMGQFLTPPPAASLLAGMFASYSGDVRLLDSGAGVGSLTASFVEQALRAEHRPRSLHLIAWECESAFIPGLTSVLECCVRWAAKCGVPASYEVKEGDFLSGALELLSEPDLFRAGTKPEKFTHAIMNPPYRKIQTSSHARLLLRKAGLETSNLYTGFMWLVSGLLREDGQMVAITPRSFCNGPYFLPFRRKFFDRMALSRVHVFDRRDTLFAGDAVLQENIIMAARRSVGAPETVVLSSTSGSDQQAVRERVVPYARVVDSSDESRVVHLALDLSDDDVKASITQLPATLRSLGIEVSTGRVVDFRARPFLRRDPEEGSVPLIYPKHFNGGCVHWPAANGKKPNALCAVPETEELRVPNGTYVLVKRFTAKEERRRVVATVYLPDGPLAKFKSVGFENHLNYFHKHGHVLDRPFAKGLALYLNSSAVDLYFRQFSGHTQVNATDLRSLRYPSAPELRRLGEEFAGDACDQAAIDGAVARLLEGPRR